MALLNNPFTERDNPELKKLIDLYNNTEKNNDLQRIFYLQKINFLLTQTSASELVTSWVNTSAVIRGSWQDVLVSYEIDPNASSLLQATQFANVVANSIERPAELQEEKAQKLLEARDRLLKQNTPFEQCKKQYIELSYRISQVFARLENPITRITSQSKQRVLKVLINQFNALDQDDHVQRIFHLQRIQHALNKISLNEALFNWRNAHPDLTGTWESLLTTYGIDPDGSFFLKSTQFAKAVKSRMKSYPSLDNHKSYNDIYQLMQQRDALLEKTDLAENDRTLYIALCCRIDTLAENQLENKDRKTRHQYYLTEAKDKLNAIKGHSKKVNTKYKTAALGVHHANNYNFKLTIEMQQEVEKLDKSFVLRIEDRSELSIEQKLHSYPVCDYFADDVTFTMVKLEDENNDLVYKPMVLSQFANEGDLRNVAKKLRTANTGTILSTAKHYFQHLNDFCLQLQKADVYHPDIKLSNFLVNNKKLIVADRKTFVSGREQAAENLRSTPQYAPQQYTECLNDEQNDYIQPKARLTKFDMEQFMTYQVGMALKEFLLLSQMDNLPKDYRDADCDLVSHFKKPSPQIKNYALLIHEMTREEEGTRLSIAQMQKLLISVNKSPVNFYEELEKVHPSTNVGLEQEVNEINSLLTNNQLSNEELLQQANAIFLLLVQRTPEEPRLHRLAEKLAVKCHNQCSQAYFSEMSKSIENTLLAQDWPHATWYQKIPHILSFGYFRVPQVTDVTTIKIPLNFSEPEFQSHFTPFAFLPETQLQYLGGTQSAHLVAFLGANMGEIKAVLSRAATEAHSASHSLIMNNLQDESPSGSIIIHNIDAPEEDSDESLSGSVVIHKKEKKEAEDEEESLSGSVVIYKKEKKEAEDEEESLSGSVVIHKKEKKEAEEEESLSGSVVIHKKEKKETEDEEESLSGSVVIHKKKMTQQDPSAASSSVVPASDSSKETNAHKYKGFFAIAKQEESSCYKDRKKDRRGNRGSVHGVSLAFKGDALPLHSSLLAAICSEERHSVTDNNTPLPHKNN